MSASRLLLLLLHIIVSLPLTISNKHKVHKHTLSHNHFQHIVLLCDQFISPCLPLSQGKPHRESVHLYTSVCVCVWANVRGLEDSKTLIIQSSLICRTACLCVFLWFHMRKHSHVACAYLCVLHHGLSTHVTDNNSINSSLLCREKYSLPLICDSDLRRRSWKDRGWEGQRMKSEAAVREVEWGGSTRGRQDKWMW